jgi:ZIP family zinc transporter/zinc and cadmium transporter
VNALALAATAALGIVVGAIAVARGGPGRLRAIDATVGFGAGFLLALVVLALVPEVLAAEGVRGAAAVLAGYLVVLLAQQFVAPHFHFGEERHPVSRVSALSAVCALGLHGLFDGVGIGSGLAVAPSLGVLVFAGVALHKLPEGVTVTSLMMASGWGRGAVAAAVGLVALAPPLGALLARAAQPAAPLGLGLAAGAALYVAASNLVPEMESRGRKAMVVTLLAGVGAFVALRAALGEGG